MTTSIETRSLSDQIKDALIDDITTGARKPGERLVEMKIAEDMQTSQAPVREALRALEALGLVEMRRNRGALVRKISTDELRDIYVVRAALEGLAAEVATTRCPDIAATLHEICAEMSNSQDDRAAFVALNQQFHRTIVAASRNMVLMDVWDKLDVRSRTAINVAQNARPLAVAIAEHFAIADAMRQGDAQAARALLIEHIVSAVNTP